MNTVIMKKATLSRKKTTTELISTVAYRLIIPGSQEELRILKSKMKRSVKVKTLF